MKTYRQSILIVSLITLIITCSCNYHYYTETDTKGVKHRLKEYKSGDLQQKEDDKLIVKKYYKPENYFVDSTCISKSDTSVDCDTIKIIIHPDSKEYTCLFTKGIIPCRLLSLLYGEKNDPMRIGLITNKEIIDTTPKTLIIYKMHHLAFIKTGDTRRIISFKMTPYTYYIELTNEKAGRKTTTKEFIENSHLTWCFKSPKVEI